MILEKSFFNIFQVSPHLVIFSLKLLLPRPGSVRTSAAMAYGLHCFLPNIPNLLEHFFPFDGNSIVFHLVNSKKNSTSLDW